MEIISYEYTKQRREFGYHPSFSDGPNQIESIPSLLDESGNSLSPTHHHQQQQSHSHSHSHSHSSSSESELVKKQWLQSALTTTELDCIPEQSVHEINTERFLQSTKGTNHIDGAWPSEIKTTEFMDRQRYLRRIINEPAYANAVVSLSKVSESVLQSNNSIDLYEEYFVDDDYEYSNSSPPSSKTLCVFRDPNKIKRQATKISWHPDGAHKLAVSYSIMQFQSTPPDMPTASYIWDINSPNQPDQKLNPPLTTSLTCLNYNPRSPDHLVGGCYNGLVAFWDLRKGSSPSESSSLEYSHHDPVYDIFWIQSRSGNECCSISTDGQILWWDIRKLKKGPTDAMKMTSGNGNGLGSEHEIVYGGTALEYRADAGATRFLVGSEQGVGLLCDRKSKKESSASSGNGGGGSGSGSGSGGNKDNNNSNNSNNITANNPNNHDNSQKSIKYVYGGNNNGQHFSPIYSIQRNPFNVKYFMTVGDWTAKIWMEDLKSPLFSTKYDRSYLTSGCWSPSRPGVMFTTKLDGTLDIWDYYHKQNSPTFSTKVSDCGLTSIKVQNQGKLVGLGSSDGTVTVLSLSKNLYELQKDEKNIIATMFERETRREKNLEMRYIQKKREEKEKEKAQKEEEEKEKKRKELSSSQNQNNIQQVSLVDDENDEETKEILRKAEEEFYSAIDLNLGSHSGQQNNFHSTLNQSNEEEKESKQLEIDMASDEL